MTSSQIRTYARGYRSLDNEPADFIAIIQSITPLTRVGALCFVFGKLMGILAIPAAFIPSLNLFVVPLVIIWGSMVFTAIVLCSVDHYRKKRAEAGRNGLTPPVHDTVEASLGDQVAEEESQPVIIPLMVSRS
jgi:hypothetical protein